MSGRILIVDTVATNRIVMKVKMLTARYAVDTCANRTEAEAMITLNRPDLILMNLSDPVEDRHSFCRAIKDDPDTTDIAVIAIGVADTSRARFAALDSGADDVMPRPIEDSFLMARIRSLLRMRHAGQELWLRDGTSRALGFDDARRPFDMPAHIAVITPDNDLDLAHHDRACNALDSMTLRHVTLDHALERAIHTPTPDLFIIDQRKVVQNEQNSATLYRLVSDLRSRAETRFSAQLIILPAGAQAAAALALDLGADDVAVQATEDTEIALRARALIGRKQQQDRLRDTVRNGMHAAVTDPLTGLYNRRYAEPHLQRMAKQCHAAGRDFVVMMLDIDHFKAINDTHGHAAGDQVLVQIAARLRENLRAIDLIARIGGEEFLVAMPQTSAEQAEAAAERLRSLITSAPFKVAPNKPTLSVTVSVGVALGDAVTIACPTLGQMFDRADAALYAAKMAGRNTVSMAPTAA